MTARYVMLPTEAGEIVIDADRVVYAMPVGDGSTRVNTIGGVSFFARATPDRVAALLGTLKLQITADGVMSFFNHRHLDFASVKAGGNTILHFQGGHGATLPHDRGETLVQLLSQLE